MRTLNELLEVRKTRGNAADLYHSIRALCKYNITDYIDFISISLLTRFDEISTIAKQLKNHKKIKDMSKILTGILRFCVTSCVSINLCPISHCLFLSLAEFENLGRAFTKAKNVIDKEGIPTMFVKCLVELEDFIKEVWLSVPIISSVPITSVNYKLCKYKNCSV